MYVSLSAHNKDAAGGKKVCGCAENLLKGRMAMAWEDKRGENPQEREKRPGTDTGPFTPDGEYDSLDAWADEDER